MPNIVIVSARCYLLCEAINHISIDICGDMYDEDGEIKFDTRKPKTRNKKAKAKSKSVAEKEAARKEAARLEELENTFYQITINFVPVSSGGASVLRGGGTDNRQVQITIRGHDKAMAIYGEMVTQIREQLPDQMFLDKLVDKLLGNTQ